MVATATQAGKEAEHDKQRKHSILPEGMGGGPHGVGDPNDRTLRKIEKDVLINNIIRDRAQEEKCREVFMEFLQCNKRSGFWAFITCKPEVNRLNECMDKWFNNEDFRAECTEQYLEKRRIFRETGVGQKLKQKTRII